MLTLLTALIGAVPLVADSPHVASPPAIQITLNGGGNYYPGGLVNVRVTTNDDGYLIVFRVDGDGRIRVLFPLDPERRCLSCAAARIMSCADAAIAPRSWPTIKAAAEWCTPPLRISHITSVTSPRTATGITTLSGSATAASTQKLT